MTSVRDSRQQNRAARSKLRHAIASMMHVGLRADPVRVSTREQVKMLVKQRAGADSVREREGKRLQQPRRLATIVTISVSVRRLRAIRRSDPGCCPARSTARRAGSVVDGIRAK